MTTSTRATDTSATPCAGQCGDTYPLQDMWLCADDRPRCWECMKIYDAGVPSG